MKVPWPVSIVLDEKAENVYNEVFRFIFKVKRAIWALEQLRFQGKLHTNQLGFVESSFRREL